MIVETMRFGLLKNHLIYIIVLFYFLVPVLDSMSCAHCEGNLPFRSKTTIGHLQASHNDVAYSTKGGSQSKAPSKQDVNDFCSICANTVLGVEVFSTNLHAAVSQYKGTHVIPVPSGPHYSINKPPQNLLV